MFNLGLSVNISSSAFVLWFFIVWYVLSVSGKINYFLYDKCNVRIFSYACKRHSEIKA